MLSIPQLFGIWFMCLFLFTSTKCGTSIASDIDRKYSESSSFSHSSSTDKTFPLVVNVWPINAKIRVMNITQKYDRYMLLPKDTYIVEVSAKGYETESKKVRHDKYFYIHRIALDTEKGS